jgi:hypothetical protein
LSSGRNQRFWRSLFQELSFQKHYHPNTVFGTLRSQWIGFWAMLWFPFGFWNGALCLFVQSIDASRGIVKKLRERQGSGDYHPPKSLSDGKKSK